MCASNPFIELIVRSELRIAHAAAPQKKSGVISFTDFLGVVAIFQAPDATDAKLDCAIVLI